MNIPIDDLLAGHGINSGIGRGGGALEPKFAQVTLSRSAYVAELPSSLAYNPTQDMLLVFQNSVFIAEGTDYTVAEDASTIITSDGDWDEGTTFDFLVIANTKQEVETYDGTLLGDGSIGESKLEASIQEQIGGLVHFGTVLDHVQDVERQMTHLREVVASAYLQTEATELITTGDTFGGNGTFSFGVMMDTAQTGTTASLPSGSTVLTLKVERHDVFAAGQTITIYDDQHAESVEVTRATDTELEVTPLEHAYASGAVLARSTLVPDAGGGYVAPAWGGGQGPGVARFLLGTTDEAVLWTTQTGGGTSLRSRFDEDAFTSVTGETEDMVTQWVLVNETPGFLEVELTLEAGAKLQKYLGAIG